MARPREFDTDQALEQAMQVFWSKGYEATSLHDLLEAMGLSKSSFYETFGCKHELFLAAMDRYNRTAATRGPAAALAAAPNARAGIAAVFEGAVEGICACPERRGCFVNNCAVEMAPHDPAVAAKAAEGMALTEEAFFETVRRAQVEGDISVAHDARVLARYLTSSLSGLLVLAKAKPDKRTLRQVVRVVLSALD
jgi:TetR/AcrR family transcriptional repressor of nem operon